jgi:hypothetical protein
MRWPFSLTFSNGLINEGGEPYLTTFVWDNMTRMLGEQMYRINWESWAPVAAGT